MKIMTKPIGSFLQGLGFLILLGSTFAYAADDSAELLKQGEYIARAADCVACHRTVEKAGADFAGGYGIDSPMGKMIASNITPSKQYGIGNYTERQFADAVRKGVAADGKYLYPGMPYTAYQGMSDDDIHSLYTYLMQGIKPVDIAVAETRLDFPFNIRQLMFGWDLLFLDQSGFKPNPDLSQQLNRGQYLVDHLAHCGTCHTPRGLFMAEDNSRYLAGASLGGWIAPNITTDQVAGIGGWSEQEIVLFLKNGHLANKAQAAGSMAEAVENSFRYLTEQDMQAMAAYLKTIQPVSDAKQQVTAYSESRVPAVDMSQIEAGQGAQSSLADSQSDNGGILYNSACASCHGANGKGTADHFYPSLRNNSTVGSYQPNNLVMVIVEGIARKGADGEVSMPAFGEQLNNQQIAAVVNYVTQSFGQQQPKISADEVDKIRQGGDKPLLLVAVPYLMGLAVLMILSVIMLIFRKRKTK